MAAAHNRPFDAIVFDLGGVLIELGGVTRMLELLDHRVTVEELWARWLSSPSVSRFETGRMDANQFALALLAEFELPLRPAQFLAEFTAWPKGLYPGAIDLLHDGPESAAGIGSADVELVRPRVGGDRSRPVGVGR